MGMGRGLQCTDFVPSGHLNITVTTGSLGEPRESPAPTVVADLILPQRAGLGFLHPGGMWQAFSGA